MFFVLWIFICLILPPFSFSFCSDCILTICNFVSDHSCWFLQHDPSKEYKTTEDCGLKLEFINVVYDLLTNLVSTALIISTSIHKLSDEPGIAWLVGIIHANSPRTYSVIVCLCSNNDHHSRRHQSTAAKSNSNVEQYYKPRSKPESERNGKEEEQNLLNV